MKAIKISAGWKSTVIYVVADSHDEILELARNGVYACSWTYMDFLFGYLNCMEVN